MKEGNRCSTGGNHTLTYITICVLTCASSTISHQITTDQSTKEPIHLTKSSFIGPSNQTTYCTPLTKTSYLTYTNCSYPRHHLLHHQTSVYIATTHPLKTLSQGKNIQEGNDCKQGLSELLLRWVVVLVVVILSWLGLGI